MSNANKIIFIFLMMLFEGCNSISNQNENNKEQVDTTKYLLDTNITNISPRDSSSFKKAFQNIYFGSPQPSEDILIQDQPNYILDNHNYKFDVGYYYKNHGLFYFILRGETLPINQLGETLKGIEQIIQIAYGNPVIEDLTPNKYNLKFVYTFLKNDVEIKLGYQTIGVPIFTNQDSLSESGEHLKCIKGYTTDFTIRIDFTDLIRQSKVNQEKKADSINSQQAQFKKKEVEAKGFQ